VDRDVEGGSSVKVSTLTGLFVAYTLTSVAGLLLLRVGIPAARDAYGSQGLLSRDSALAAAGVAAYGTSFLLWMVILAQVPVARAYPIAVGLTLAFTAIGAHVLLRENLSALNVLGILAVFSGVVLISAS
jgi:multidrug transporter EmrE-like cation transporter